MFRAKVMVMVRVRVKVIFRVKVMIRARYIFGVAKKGGMEPPHSHSHISMCRQAAELLSTKGNNP